MGLHNYIRLKFRAVCVLYLNLREMMDAECFLQTSVRLGSAYNAEGNERGMDCERASCVRRESAWYALYYSLTETHS